MNTKARPYQHDELLARVGHMTRLLHDSLRGLGLDKLLERAAEDIPMLVIVSIMLRNYLNEQLNGC